MRHPRLYQSLSRFLILRLRISSHKTPDRPLVPAKLDLRRRHHAGCNKREDIFAIFAIVTVLLVHIFYYTCLKDMFSD